MCPKLLPIESGEMRTRARHAFDTGESAKCLIAPIKTEKITTFFLPAPRKVPDSGSFITRARENRGVCARSLFSQLSADGEARKKLKNAHSSAISPGYRRVLPLPGPSLSCQPSFPSAPYIYLVSRRDFRSDIPLSLSRSPLTVLLLPSLSAPHRSDPPQSAQIMGKLEITVCSIRTGGGGFLGNTLCRNRWEEDIQRGKKCSIPAKESSTADGIPPIEWPMIYCLARFFFTFASSSSSAAKLKEEREGTK